jgi:hypothetical protein
VGLLAGDSGEPPDHAGEVVTFGRGGRGPARPGLSTLLVVALLLGAIVTVAVRSSRGGAHPPPAVSVTRLRRPVLGVRGGWQLFGYGPGRLDAVQPAAGRVVRTAIPPLPGDGLVSLVAAPGEVIIRPLDNVTGYVVRDGRPARPLTGALAHGGTLLPGPTAAQQWLDGDALVLVGSVGTSQTADLPSSALLWAPQVPVISDGRGGLVLTGARNTVYDATARNGALRAVDALPVAVGPRDWLGLRCAGGTCANVVVSLATGASRPLPGPAVYGDPWPWQALPGVVSPDGTTAAVLTGLTGRVGERPALELVSLVTGKVTQVPVPVGPTASSASLAWSPDSRWLFAVTARGTLAAADGRTGRLQHLQLGLSGLSQIVIRPAAG